MPADTTERRQRQQPTFTHWLKNKALRFELGNGSAVQDQVIVAIAGAKHGQKQKRLAT